MSLLNNPLFWLGELGLCVVILHCILVCYRERGKIPTVAIFFTLAVLSLNVLVHPALILPPVLSPGATYLFRFVLGIAATYREVQLYRDKKKAEATEAEQQELSVTKKILTWGLVGAGLILGWIGLKIR